jgi:recombination protein RecT
MTDSKTQQQQTPAIAGQNGTNGVKKFEEGTVDIVLSRIQSFQTNGDLKLPASYSPENAIRSAWLILQDVKDMNKQPALQVCTKESIANALLDMVLQGLSPVKKQCYFVVYGNKLNLQKSYIGTIAVSKRVANVKEVKAIPVYEGDVFKYEIDIVTGRKKIIEHTQEFKNIDPDKTAGAYAIITENDDKSWVEVMTMKQIRKAWEMGNAKGNSPAHKNFADEMACKTVINRALKVAIGSSDDGDLFLEEEQLDDALTAGVKHQIELNANKKEMAMDEHESDQSNVITAPGGEKVNTETGEVLQNGDGAQNKIEGPGF